MENAAVNWRSGRSILILIGFIALVVVVGGLIGTQSLPDDWYTGLAKPPFNPPNWVFGPVWTTLYVLIGIAGWRTFMRNPRSGAMAAWVVQMLLNWAWSPVWFTLHMLWPAFIIIALILLAILVFISLQWNRDRFAAILFLPYLAWVTFASLLNLSIAILN